MKELSFKVAAKTARLFGRENVSNAEGAISELVKNTYDADATFCLICFLPRYSTAPQTLRVSEFEWLSSRQPGIETYYALSDTNYRLNENQYDLNRDDVDDMLASLIDLWIIDNGEGMTATTIEDYWMVIGTNFKEQNITSDKGRARTGAKGIGRFALDRLGSECQLYSRSDVSGAKKTVDWNVDWNDFDVAGQTLEDIKARLSEDTSSLASKIGHLDDYPEISKALRELAGTSFDWPNGTAIQIGLLRDEWTSREVSKLYKTLAELIPPSDQKVLNLFLFDVREPTEYGIVSADILDDFDYKIEADVMSSGTINIKLTRNELEVERIDPDLFELDEMKGPRFNESSFRKRVLEYSKGLEELFPGAPEDFRKNAEALGSFKSFRVIQDQPSFLQEGLAKLSRQSDLPLSPVSTRSPKSMDRRIRRAQNLPRSLRGAPLWRIGWQGLRLACLGAARRPQSCPSLEEGLEGEPTEPGGNGHNFPTRECKTE